MKANNYEVADAGETITFKGVVQRSVSQALFLVFVTAMSMATLALVLNIQFNDLGTLGMVLLYCGYLDILVVTIAHPLCCVLSIWHRRITWDWKTELVSLDPDFTVCRNLLLE